VTWWVIGDRQTGKTTAMIGWLRLDPNNMLLVPTERQKSLLCSQYPHLAPRIKVISDVLYRDGFPVDTRLGIDDLDSFLHRMLGVHFPIDAVSASGKTVELRHPRRSPAARWNHFWGRRFDTGTRQAQQVD
jgi:hypothetical protein